MYGRHPIACSALYPLVSNSNDRVLGPLRVSTMARSMRNTAVKALSISLWYGWISATAVIKLTMGMRRSIYNDDDDDDNDNNNNNSDYDSIKHTQQARAAAAAPAPATTTTTTSKQTACQWRTSLSLTATQTLNIRISVSWNTPNGTGTLLLSCTYACMVATDNYDTAWAGSFAVTSILHCYKDQAHICICRPYLRTRFLQLYQCANRMLAAYM